MIKGHIRLLRKIKESDLWPESEEREFTKLEAWIDLIMVANIEDKDYHGITVRRGDIVTKYSTLANRWKWSRSKVKHFMAECRKKGRVTSKPLPNRLSVHLTICKYNYFHGVIEPPNHLRTTSEPLKGNENSNLQEVDVRPFDHLSTSNITKESRINKKNKEVLSEIAQNDALSGRRSPEINGSHFSDIWTRYPNKVGKKAAQRSFGASVKTEEDWSRINQALENYLASDRVSKGYVQNGRTWFANWSDWEEFQEQPRIKKDSPGVKSKYIIDEEQALAYLERKAH